MVARTLSNGPSRVRAAATLLAAAAALVLSAPANAMVGDWPLGKMAAGSDVILIGRVVRLAPEEIGEPPESLRIATAEVLSVVKGRPGERVRFLAEPTWSCDLSSASGGETALLFLERWERSRDGEDPIYLLALSGRGRLRITEMDGVRYASGLGGEVQSPPELTEFASPDPDRCDWDRALPLDPLLAWLERVLAPVPAPADPRAAAVHRLLNDLFAEFEPTREQLRELEAFDERDFAVVLGLLDDPASPLRTAAAEALFWLEDRGLEVIRTAFASEVAVRRRGAAFALRIQADYPGDLPDEVLPDLLAAARDADVRVRAHAVAALAGVSIAEALPGVVAALGDGAPAVRACAARALDGFAWMFDWHGAEPPVAEIERRLLVMAGGEDPDERHAAWDALALVAGAASLPAVRRVGPDADPFVRRAATVLLARIPGEEAQDRLLARLAWADAGCRRLAVKTLGEGRVVRAVGALAGALADPEAGVRRAACEALGEIGPAAAEAIPALERALRSAEETTARDALRRIRGE